MCSSILIGENIYFILQTVRTLHFGWKTYLVCSIWNLYAQHMNFTILMHLNGELNIATI